MVFFCLFLKKKALKKFQIFILSIVFIFVTSCIQNKEVGISPKLFQKEYYKNKKPEQKIKFLDSITSFSKQIKNDSVNRHLLFDISNEYYYQNQFKKSFDVCKQILHLSNVAKDTFSIAKTFFYMGDTYEISQKDSAYYYYQKSEKLYRILNDREQLGRMLFKKASILFFEGNYIESETQISNALQYLKKSSDAEMLFSAYNLMGCNFEKLEEYDNSLKYFLLANNLLRNREKFDPESIYNYEITSMVNISNIYDKKKQYKKSIILLSSLLKKDFIRNAQNYYPIVISNLGYSKMKSGNLKGVENIFKEALSISLKNGTDVNVVYKYLNLGEYYSLIKDTTKSVNYLKQSLRLAEKIKAGEEIKTALKMLSKIDYRNAAKYDKRYIFINDSLTKAQRINRNKYARIEYETSVVEDENKLLSAKNTYILIGAFILTLVLILIIAYRYVKNQKREKVFREQQQQAEEEIFDLLKSHQIKLNEVKITEQKRISFELHDGILNKLFSIRLQLGILNESDAEDVNAKREIYIDMLEKLEDEIRDISHELQTDFIDAQIEYSSLLQNLILEKNELKITTFAIDIDNRIDWEPISGLVKITIYRIAQEAIHNVVKYAVAKNCVVSINRLKNNALELTITDDGNGFEIESIVTDGIGLKNMRERAKSIKAKFDISSESGKGTKIQVVFENPELKKE